MTSFDCFGKIGLLEFVLDLFFQKGCLEFLLSKIRLKVLDFKMIKECIPVGYVLPTSVAVSAGGGPLWLRVCMCARGSFRW